MTTPYMSRPSADSPITSTFIRPRLRSSMSSSVQPIA